MIVEAVQKAITYRWPGGEVCLAPGCPVDLPEDRALKLLAKAPGKVRIVTEPAAAADEMVIELALPCRPVYWQSMDGQVHGPCPVRLMARTIPPAHCEFWLCVEDQGQTVWIREDRLRSHH